MLNSAHTLSLDFQPTVLAGLLVKVTDDVPQNSTMGKASRVSLPVALSATGDHSGIGASARV
jgi:hypothetical protein